MQVYATPLPEFPTWQRHTRRRRVASLVLATVAVAAFVLLVEFSPAIDPGLELELKLLPKTEPFRAEPVVDLEPEQMREELPVVVDAPEPAMEPITVPRDWYAQIEAVARETIDSQPRVYSINPVLDKKRRTAAVKFAPSRAPVARPIWENVETDQLGRKILVSGDCYRVIDDPSGVNNEIFRTFQQYLVYCNKYKSAPKELPWVDDIRIRYEYLARRK
jgi:hypothetical protein